MSERVLKTRKEAAQWLNVSLRTLDALIAEKKLPVKRFGRRIMIHQNDLDQIALRGVARI